MADTSLATTGHSVLPLREIASAAGGTHPAILKQFGSRLGFLAALASLQWQRATALLDQADDTPLALALAGVEFAIDNPDRFRLMYDPALWQAVGEAGRHSTRVGQELRAFELARDENYLRFLAAMGSDVTELEVRKVTALLTGLCFEFVNERLYDGDKQLQLAHAEELLRSVIDG